MGAPKVFGSCPLGTTTDLEAEIENPCPAAGQCCIPHCKTFVLPFFPFSFYFFIFPPQKKPPKLRQRKKRKLKRTTEEVQNLYAKILPKIHVVRIQIHNQASPNPFFSTTKTIILIMRISIYYHHLLHHHYSKNNNYNPFFLRTLLLLLRPIFFLQRINHL